MSDTAPPVDPAPLVPADQRAELVRVTRDAVTAQLHADPTRDADQLTAATETAVDGFEADLDLPETIWLTVDAVPARIRKLLVDQAALEMRRLAFASGVSGYDEADPAAVRASGAIRSELVQRYKARWGVA